MKRIMSTIVASLVAVAFAGIAFAAEPATNQAPASPEIRDQVTPPKPEAKKHHHKRHHKRHHHKHHKRGMKKHAENMPASPASAQPAPPAPPAN